MEQLKDRSKRVMENVEEKRMDIIRKWEEKSRDFIDAFLLLFGRDGRLVSGTGFSSFLKSFRNFIFTLGEYKIRFFDCSLTYGMKVKAG